METSIPNASSALKTLLAADFTTQWRNRKAVMLTLIIPVIIVASWKGIIPKKGGTFVLSNGITIGLMAIGLMGYSITISRDRDKGIFQRLRVAPISTSTIMASRLLVQLAMIFLVTTAVFVAGAYIDEVKLSLSAYILSYFTAIVGGALYLGLGQMIVGLIQNPEAVNSTVRLVYFVFIMVGTFGQVSDYTQLNTAVHWSPYGTVKTILAAGMEPTKWTNDTSTALLVILGYIVVFTTLGIKWFKWSTK